MFYHGTHYLFNKGFKLKPKNKNKYTDSVNIKEVEDFFENEKPSDKISRRNAIFLCDNVDNIDNCGGYTDIIYTVEAKQTECSDLHWYSQACSYFENNNLIKAKENIKKYWSGELAEKELSCPEFRTREAFIIDVFELNVEKNELTTLEEITVLKNVLKNKIKSKNKIKCKR